MTNFKILDCTLRDGGYVNNWDFGKKNIKNIINALVHGNVEIVELGFFEDIDYDENCTMFSDISQIKALNLDYTNNTEYVVLTRLNRLDLDRLSNYENNTFSSIRVTFHIDQIEEALLYCRRIKEKGYKVYVQPIGTTAYTDEQLLRLIKYVNQLKPYVFSVVDTLGVMTRYDVRRVMLLVDHNLDKEISIGYHSHNNLQLSFSNAQEILDMRMNREVVIDSSIHGMGRGAGNLHTELIMQYINTVLEERYNIPQILQIIDSYISLAKDIYEWGYTIPYYLAASHQCHPNYSTFLNEKKTLDVTDISYLLTKIPDDNKDIFNKKIMEELYYDFQNRNIDDGTFIENFSAKLVNKEILIIAPGKSITIENDKINQHIDNDTVVISVNFQPEFYRTDYNFFSNSKRIHSNIDKVDLRKLIITSNITDFDTSNIANYSSCQNNYNYVSDNATLMLLSLLQRIKVTSVMIAGFDGYSLDKNTSNYRRSNMETKLEDRAYIHINDNISKFLKEYVKSVQINFLTNTEYNY